MKATVVRFGFLGLLACALLPFFSGQAQQAGAPFLYYYSDYWNGYVIERADGSEQHLIGAGLMPADADPIWSEWSASGEWLAWTGNQWGVNDANGRVPYAAHLDGQRHLTMLDGYQDAVLAWSPNSDWLFVVGVVGVQETGANVQMQIINAASDTVINSYSLILEAEHSDWIPFEVYWGKDEQNVSYAIAVQYTPRSPRHVVYVMSADTVTKYEINGGYTVAPDGMIYSIHGNQIYRFHPLTGEPQEVVSVTGGSLSLSSAAWHPTEPIALIPMERGDQSELWLLDAEQNTIESLGYIRIDLPFFEPAPEGSRLWSPDGRYAAFVTTIGTLQLFDPQTRQVTSLMEDVWYKLWVSPTRMNVYNEDGQIFLVDVEQGIIAEGEGEDSFYLSPDGTAFLTIQESSKLANLVGGLETLILPHNALSPSERGGEVLWNREWFLLLHYNAPGFIGKGDMLITVGNLSQTVFRDLERCQQFWFDADGETGCGWLPERVPANKLGESVDLSAPVPALTRIGTDYAGHLAWSPDGQQIAIGVYNQSYPEDPRWTFIWEVETGQLSQIFEPAEYATLEWIPSGDGHFTAQLGDPAGQEPVNFLELKRAISPDGAFYVRYDVEDPPADGTEQCLRLYQFDAATDERLFALENSRKCDLDGRPIFQLDYSPDGRLIAGGSAGSYLHLWDTATGELAAVPNVWAMSAAFSPDGEYVAVGASWRVHVYLVDQLLNSAQMR